MNVSYCTNVNGAAGSTHTLFYFISTATDQARHFEFYCKRITMEEPVARRLRSRDGSRPAAAGNESRRALVSEVVLNYYFVQVKVDWHLWFTLSNRYLLNNRAMPPTDWEINPKRVPKQRRNEPREPLDRPP